MLKMTRMLMIDFLKVNEGRRANGIPDLAWEEYSALIEARTPPEILPVKFSDIAARAREDAAGLTPVDPRPVDFIDYALGDTQPDNIMDAALYAKNLALTRAMMPHLPSATKQELYRQMQVSQTLSEPLKDAATAEALAQTATLLGYDIDALAGQIAPMIPSGAGATDVFRAIQNEIGRTFEHIGAEVKRWTKIPILNKIIGPMGTKVFGEVLFQTGRMLHGGSVRDWDDRAFVASVGETMHDMGMLCVTAAPFLPAPWNAVIAAIGAVSLAASKAINGHIATQEDKERYERELAAANDLVNNANAQAMQAEARQIAGYHDANGVLMLYDNQSQQSRRAPAGQWYFYKADDGHFYYYEAVSQAKYPALDPPPYDIGVISLSGAQGLTGAGCGCSRKS